MRKPAKGFEDLVVWHKAHSFVIDIYRLTQSFPQHETYGLTSQIRRSAISIPANIAEGFKKRSKADKVRFLNIAQGSLEETRYYLVLVRDLDYGDTTVHLGKAEEISKMLSVYMSSILNSGF